MRGLDGAGAVHAAPAPAPHPPIAPPAPPGALPQRSGPRTPFRGRPPVPERWFDHAGQPLPSPAARAVGQQSAPSPRQGYGTIPPPLLLAAAAVSGRRAWAGAGATPAPRRLARQRRRADERSSVRDRPFHRHPRRTRRGWLARATRRAWSGLCRPATPARFRTPPHAREPPHQGPPRPRVRRATRRANASGDRGPRVIEVGACRQVVPSGEYGIRASGAARR
jgi:hypothetical protein